MSSFTTELKVKSLPDNKRWELLEEFDYYLGNLDSGLCIKVPKGFVTDFASVPRLFWLILPPWDKYGKAAVLHDYLYHSGKFTRILCDTIFYEAMTVSNVSFWKRCILYLGVRIGGWLSYNRYQK
ncbi:hypothetical protein DRN73_08220 [Candidatus Pacearchaeota archaeon]|nr:MAG: hypothetical protein DRN73_08220 [Candidatus Pacearchaeota archaeon]